MDELISLLPIVITLAIAIFAARNSRKKQANQEHEAPFPFFTEQNDDEAFDDDVFTRKISGPPQVDEQPQGAVLSKLRTNYTEDHFKQNDNQDDNRLTADKIDLKHAVIYSEILKPKFED